MSIYPILGRPGVGPMVTLRHGYVMRAGPTAFWPGGGLIDTAKSRDLSNTLAPLLLNAGKLMGKIDATGYWANSIIGVTQAAILGSGTTLSLTAAAATELVRRQGGTSGTFSLVGPPVANATARRKLVTFSNVNTSTGDVTVTAVAANEVQTITFNATATAGNLQLIVPRPDGTLVQTGNAAWNATDATFLSNINTALDAATGVSGGIVATGAAPDDALTLTYSGAGYAGEAQPLAAVGVYPTGPVSSTVVRTTGGASGGFVAGSLVGGGDGSEYPRSVVFDGYGITLGTDSANTPALIEWPWIPTDGTLEIGQIIDFPADLGSRQWIVEQMNRIGGGRFIFSDKF